jgi:hypothetical protein
MGYDSYHMNIKLCFFSIFLELYFPNWPIWDSFQWAVVSVKWRFWKIRGLIKAAIGCDWLRSRQSVEDQLTGSLRFINFPRKWAFNLNLFLIKNGRKKSLNYYVRRKTFTKTWFVNRRTVGSFWKMTLTGLILWRIYSMWHILCRILHKFFVA